MAWERGRDDTFCLTLCGVEVMHVYKNTNQQWEVLTYEALQSPFESILTALQELKQLIESEAKP